jgi:hypothetical protein
MKKKKKEDVLQKWKQKIDWNRRVNAVCKPCWEIQYCPYGPLVEQFPLKERKDEKSCRIFGHDCPVFFVAEPFTETKELRNISRRIPRVTQFRVLKRENQICSKCGTSVKDEDVEFDHIIPWSKGGSSDERNVRLLCKKCNRKKGNKFEEDHLVSSYPERIVEPSSFELLEFLLITVGFSQAVYGDEGRYPTAKEYAAGEKVTFADERCVELLAELDGFFNAKKPPEIKQKLFKALSYRWGMVDRSVHLLSQAAQKYGVDLNDLFLAELNFINRLGWPVRLTKREEQRWKSL